MDDHDELDEPTPAEDQPGPAGPHRIGGEAVSFRAPDSFAHCYNIYAAAASSAPFAFAAALAACWNGKGRPKARIERYKFDVLLWGAAVFDELHGRGISSMDIQRYGAMAYALIARRAITDDEVRAAEGFTGAPPDKSIS